MNWVMSLQIALRALRVNALRSGLAMLGIVIGVGAVITMIAVGRGAQTSVEEQIASLGSNLILVTPGSRTASGVRLGSGSVTTLTEDDALALMDEIPGVQVAAPNLRGSGQLATASANWASPVYGVTPEYFEVREWALGAGRIFEEGELKGAAKVAVIGETVARKLYGDGNPVGQEMRLRKVPFTIVGVLARKGQSPDGKDQDDVVLVPLSTFRNRIWGGWGARVGSVREIAVKVRDQREMSEVEAQIAGLLRQRHKIPITQDDDFTVQNLTQVLETQEASSRVLALLLAAVASVSLLVGGIGIMNIMLVSVTERTREIGLRMAVGASGSDILTQFLVEAVTLSLLGGLIGVLAGVGTAYGVGGLAGWRTELSLDAILLAVGFAAGIGVFFGLYPARKAARLEPVEALRHE